MEAAQWKPVEIAPAGEHHDEQDGEQEAGNGVADDDHPRGPDIEALAVAHRVGDAERNRDHVNQQGRPQPQRDRHRHLLDYQVDHPAVAEEALAKVEADIVPQHHEEALAHRLVEAELALESLDQLGIEPLGATILAGDAAAALAAGVDDVGGAGAADPRGEVDAGAFDGGDELLDGPARRRLDDEEVDHHDPEQGGDDQQQPTDDVGEHGALSVGRR